MAHQLLIADDQEDVLLVLEELFSSRGYLVAKASDGDEAVERMREVSPDLILVDYQMPGKNGVEVLQIARESAPDAIRILLTAHGDLDVAIAAINQADVYKFIPKPWNNNDLILTVQRALEHYDLIRQNRAFADTLELMVDENTQEIERLRSALQDLVAKIRGLVP